MALAGTAARGRAQSPVAALAGRPRDLRSLVCQRGGRVAGATRRRADVPSLRTFQEGIAAALSPGQRAGLRAGSGPGGSTTPSALGARRAQRPVGGGPQAARHRRAGPGVRPSRPALDHPVRRGLLASHPRLVVVGPAELGIDPGRLRLGGRGHPRPAVGRHPGPAAGRSGSDFLSNTLRGACGRLGVVLDPAPPDAPFRKGKVEVAGKLVERALLPPLAGYGGRVPRPVSCGLRCWASRIWSTCCGRASTPGIAPTSIPSTAARWPRPSARRHAGPHGG